MPGPRLDAEQEVRFAVVMYGGVSLAIYINGIVQELLRLVRATAPTVSLAHAPLDPDVDSPARRAWFATKDLKGTELVYRKVGQLLPYGGAGAKPDEGEEQPIRTRFVVDILSGTSAGGINAIFLAKAIANQQRIDALRNLWIRDGDIGELLNDRASYKNLEGVKREKPPQALLNSSRLFVKARQALNLMEDTSEKPRDDFVPAYAEEVNLSVTTTDLQGLQLPLKLSDLVVYEARHRNVLKFGYASPDATGERRNDFGAANNEILAFAARATSAFPFAFSPAVPSSAPLTSDSDPAEEWKQFFPDYAARDVEFTKFAFADGGYLDNKPFSYATDELRRRRADVPVKRKLLYIEPDPPRRPRSPEASPPSNDPREPPDAVDNVVAALNLARKETIREDIERVARRNRAVRRINDLTEGLADSILTGYNPDRPDIGDPAAGPAVAYQAYLRLRVEQVVDDLTSAVMRLGGGREDPEEVQALRIRVREALKEVIPQDPRLFLSRHDVRFRLRRLAFVQDRVNELVRKQADPEQVTRLKAIKRELNDRFVELRRSARLTRRARAGVSEEDLPDGDRVPIEYMRELAQEINPTPEEVREILEHPAGAAVGDTFRGTLLKILDLATYQLQQPLEDVDRRVLDYLRAEQPQGTNLDAFFARFDAFDMVMLPLTYPDLEEVNPVDIVRIAPEDATNLIDEGKEEDEGRWKLAGVSLAHFGGFIDADWRRNDLMWGRFDGAERILQALMEESSERDRLIDDAHAAIIREELVQEDGGPLTEQLREAVARGDGTAAAALARLEREPSESVRLEVLAVLHQVPAGTLIDCFKKGFRRPQGTDPQRAASVASRAVDITGQVLEQATAARQVPAKPAFWASRLGRVAWGLVALAVPAGKPVRVATVVFRHWAQVAILLGVISILAGVLFGVEAAQRVGWLLVGGTLLLLALVWLLGALFSRKEDRAPPRPRGWWLVALLIAGLVLAVLAIGVASDSGFVQGLGWVLVGLGLLALLVALLTGRPDRRRLRHAAGAVAATGFVAAVAGAPHLADDIADWVPDSVDWPPWEESHQEECGDVTCEVQEGDTTRNVTNIRGGVTLRGPLFSLGGWDVAIGWPIPGPGPTTTTRRVERFFADQTFRFASAELTPEGEERMKRLRRRLTRDLGSLRGIRIWGYADYVGSPGKNRTLSWDRVETVEQALLDGLDIPAGIVHTCGFGKSRAKAKTLGDKRRAYDRRVDVVIRRERTLRGAPPPTGVAQSPRRLHAARCLP